MHACLQDSFVDCVWRESSQWLGDGLLQGMTLVAMGDDFRPIQKLLLDTADGQDETGMIPSIAPGEVHAYTIPRYACMWVELLAFYINTSGDRDFLAQWQIKSCLLNLMHFYCGTTAGKLHTTPAGMRHYIDWSPTSQNDPHCVYNLHVALAMQRAAEILPDELSHLSDRAIQQITLCRQHFYEDGVWWDDLERSTFSQLAAAMALLTGATKLDEQESLLDAIVARSLDLNDEIIPNGMVLASPFMHHYLFEALRKFGRNQAVIDIIRTRWGRWVDAGYPTTWENWNVDFPDGSQCHAFTAHPRYHLAKIFEATGNRYQRSIL